MSVRRLLSGWLATAVLLAPIAAAAATLDGLPDDLRRVLEGYQVDPATVGVFVQATDATRPLVSFNADRGFNPASTVKLLTTWLGLTELGPTWSWPTDVYLDGEVERGVLQGDLILRGYGDPYLTTDRLWSLQRQLRLRGIRDIDGDLVIDNGYFAPAAGHPDDFDGEGLRAYNVLPDALLVNFQAIELHFLPDPPRDVVRVYANPMPANLAIENRLRLKSGRCGGFRNGVALQLEGGTARDRLIVSGRYGQDCELYTMTRSVLTAPTHAYGVFRTLWEEAGGRLSGNLRVEPGLLDARAQEEDPYLRVQSPPLADVIRFINKYSNNVMSRHVFLTLGAQVFGPPATPEKARRAAKLVLRQRGMVFNGMRLDNGAGLSRTTRIAAGDLGKVLLDASYSPWFAEYVSSMSLAGLDGTLRKRFRAEPATGQMHLKTGRLNDVFATAGYVHAASGRDYAVVILQNFPDADRGPGEEAQSALLRWVYEQ